MTRARVAGLPLIITRPAPGAETTAARAAMMGIDAHALPLFAAQPCAWSCPDPGDFDALLLTSAQAPRLAGAALARLAVLPCHAVGEATADAARAAGVTLVQTGSGGAQALLDSMIRSGRRRILWLCGEDHMPLGAAQAALTVLPCYAVFPIAPAPAWSALTAGPAVLAVYSVRAAQYIAAQVGTERKHLKLAVLSQQVGDAVGDGWLEVAVADAPNDAALLSKARLLCHKAQNRVGQE